jgi:hypothetical protein
MARSLMTLLATLVLTLAACGKHDHEDGHTHDNGKSGTSHGHSHEHGKEHPLGQMDLEGGYHVGASRMGDLHAGQEAMFEIHVKKDGKAIGDASVTAWLGDADGKELTRPANCTWMTGEDLYDAHIMLPAEWPEGTRLWVRIRHAEADRTASFRLAGE